MNSDFLHFACTFLAGHVFCNLRMKITNRRLRERYLQENLKAWYECHLLQGLNGRLLPRLAQPEPDAVLPRVSAAIKRIEMLLEALQSATSPGVWGMLVPDFPSQQEFVKWANSGLKRYVQFPVIFEDPYSGKLTSKMEHCGGDEWENGAAEAILSLLREDQLHRLRRCFCCKKWFYLLRDDQRFCNTACRQKEHSQSEEFKEKRKSYMQKYRKDGNEERAKSRASGRGNRKGRK